MVYNFKNLRSTTRLAKERQDYINKELAKITILIIDVLRLAGLTHQRLMDTLGDGRPEVKF